MSYYKAKDCCPTKEEYKEEYTPRVTMPYQKWIGYVGRGDNVLLGSGGVIPSKTVQTAGGLSGAVYSGHVRQGW